MGAVRPVKARRVALARASAATAGLGLRRYGDTCVFLPLTASPASAQIPLLPGPMRRQHAIAEGLHAACPASKPVNPN
jgi:hypothetical protein